MYDEYSSFGQFTRPFGMLLISGMSSVISIAE